MARTWGLEQRPAARSLGRRCWDRRRRRTPGYGRPGGRLGLNVGIDAVRGFGDGGQDCRVGAENEYADVISQVGGPYVNVTAIMSNPNTDPHEFEASASVAGGQRSAARRPERRGVRQLHGQDRVRQPPFRPTGPRRQQLLGVPNDTFNPHLW